MNNIYNNTTNNHFQQSGITSHLLQYTEPKWASITGRMFEIYGMLIATVVDKDKTGVNKISTYRIPLVGEEMRPLEVCDQYVYEDDFFFVPADKKMTKEMFKNHLRHAIDGSEDLENTLKELKEFQFTLAEKEEQVVVEIWMHDDDSFRLDSQYFKLEIESVNKEYINPVEIYDLCLIKDFMGCEFTFKAGVEENEEEVKLAKEMERMMKAYKEFGFYSNGTIYNDGTYSYNKDFGRIKMTQEQFLEQFPQASRFI